MISIIITAYNAEKTIERCLNSILDTKYNDYEIILVNDGSTDNTESVIQLFASEKIKYFSKENTGVADSRNFGIEKAKGEYITFVDSDDYVDNNYFEDLDKYIQNDVDIIKRKGIIVSTKDVKPKIEDTNSKNKQKIEGISLNDKQKVGGIALKTEQKIEGATFDITTGEEAFNKLCFTDKFLDTLWSYVIKKSLFTDNNLFFENGKYHEDFGLLPLLILRANEVTSLNDYVYYYVQTDGSIMRENNIDKTIKKAKDALWHYDNILKTIETYNLSKFTQENVKIYLTNAILLKVNEFKILKKSKSKQKSESVDGIDNFEDDEIQTLKRQYLKAQNWYIKELKKRKIYKNIKVRNIKQLIKKIVLFINIKWYGNI